MEQFDQLLTCAICLDRYRNPKLLPCQHSFCMEPCMEGLVDYVRRQIKCPECRQEHRVPYNGVQGFPTNVTLQRFLELHIDLTGELPDPLSNQIMERCQVCSEKSYCNNCAHCDKKVCSDCKDAHMDVLKREISRISNQVRRVLHRLEDALSVSEKNTIHMQTNSATVVDEIDDLHRRLSKALKDRMEHLKNEVEKYLSNEIRQLILFRSNMEQEVANIQSNCELVERYMTADSCNPVTWQDNELMDTKDIFLKTMEFIRNFEYEPGDYARRIKFCMNQDPHVMITTLGNIGDLHLPPSIQQPSVGSGSNMGNSSGHGNSPINQSQGSALMRSKSDHRLTTQFRGQPDDDECVGFGAGRKFGEQRPIRTYGQDDDGCGDRKSRFRSRFTRHLDSSFEEPEPPPSRVRFEAPPKERERVLDTEDVTRGPISGISRLQDSPRVIQRVQETEKPPKPTPAPLPIAPLPQITPQKAATPVSAAPWRTPRQMSEEDEISKQKKQNKELEKVATSGRRQPSTEPKSPSYTESEHTTETSSTTTTQQPTSQETTTTTTPAAARVRKLSPERYPKKRSESEDSGSSESATSSGSSPAGTGAVFSTEEVKQRFLSKADGGSSATATPQRKDSTSSVASSTTGGGSSTTNASRPKFQSRFLSSTTNAKNAAEKTVEAAKEESSSSESSESESDEESDSPPPAPVVTKKPLPEVKSKMEKTDIGPLLARSANARETPSSTVSNSSTSSSLYTPRKRIEDPPAPTPPSSLSSYRRARVTSPPVRETDRYGTGSTLGSSSTTNASASSRYPSSYTSSTSDYTPSGLSRSRTGTSLYSTPDDTPSSRYSSGLTSKYLNRSRHNFDVDDLPSPTSRYGSSMSTNTSNSTGPTTRRSYLSKHTTNAADKDSSKSSRLTNLRDRRARIARSKSSHDVLAGIDLNKDHNDDEDEPESPRSPYNLYQRRKSTTVGTESEYKTPSSEDSASLSSWARYLKNKYGKDRQQPSPNQRSPVEELPKFNFTSNQYVNKKRLLFKFGQRGSDPGNYFTWPRGCASGPDGSIVVADSSNHRIQVFDQHGNFLKEFGQYGNNEGEFDCLAGVAVNRIGQFIISDRYNHRIQVFDPSGRFLRSFGSQGTSDGRFCYPWGVTTDALGFIYVCDKENHRVQVFQSDGTFVGKFGTMGSRVGELEHPHYIAVTTTNRVVVSDTNNHRIQIFDVNGKVLSSFGSEGTEDGQFKLPRGVAVDEQGYIFVGDSGNNRIQIFTPEGTFLRSFGTWGSGDGEFKGMEGLAVTPSGNIVVCDRENHRIQVF